jgi:adenylyltransferase/sulfurtransferase
LRDANPDVAIETHDARLTSENALEIMRKYDVVIDGTDNFATRYLVNDACVKHNINWIYGAAVGSYGVTMTIRPHQTVCLRCVFEETPPAGSAPTCDTAGVIMPIINIVAAVQVSEALKLLAGRVEDLQG